MGLVASSCMSSNAISSSVFSPITKKKKHREVFPQTSSTYANSDDKNSLQCSKQPRRKDKTKSDNLPPLRINVLSEDEDDSKTDIARRNLSEEHDQKYFLEKKNFLESNNREMIVSFSYSDGISRHYTLHDDPTYFIGWEVHIEGEGVGFIFSCLGPFFSGVRFEVQLQDGRVLVVPFSNRGSEVDATDEMTITFLQRVY